MRDGLTRLRIGRGLDFGYRYRGYARRENRHISAPGNRDNDALFFSLRLEILLQFGAQMPGLDTDNIVLVRIEVGLASENGTRDFAFRDFGLAARQSPAGDEQQKAPKLRSASEQMAADYPLSELPSVVVQSYFIGRLKADQIQIQLVYSTRTPKRRRLLSRAARVPGSGMELKFT